MTLDSPAPSYQWTFRRAMWATLVLASVALGFWLLYRFYEVIFILFVAIVIGTVIRPVVTWLHRRGLSRTVGVILVYLTLFALLVGFALLLFPMIVEQATTIGAAVPGYYQSLREWMVQNSNQLVVRMGAFLPATLPGLGEMEQTGEQILTVPGQALGYVGSAVSFGFVAIVVLVLALYWTLDGSRTIRSVVSLVPQDQREGIRDLASAMETMVGSYIAGQGILCLIVGSLALIAYLLIGLPNALALALVAGLLEAIPMIGPLLGAFPAALVALSISPLKLVLVIVATLVLQQVVNVVVLPRVMRKAVGVSPFVTLLAIFAFSSLFGIAGALLAIPIAAMIQLVLDRYVFHPEALEPEVSTDRDAASRLRYEAQDLAHDLRKQARLTQGGSDQRIKQIDQAMDEIEAITTDLDALLSQARRPTAP